MQISLRKATIKDSRDIWRWRNHTQVRKWCFDSRPIIYKNHKKWLENKLADADTVFYIAEDKDKNKLAQARFTVAGSKATIGINLNPLFFGRHIGYRIIKQATNSFLKMRKDASCVLAEVIGNNIASIKAFTKAGYKFKNIKIKSGRQVRVFIYKK